MIQGKVAKLGGKVGKLGGKVAKLGGKVGKLGGKVGKLDGTGHSLMCGMAPLVGQAKAAPSLYAEVLHL